MWVCIQPFDLVTSQRHSLGSLFTSPNISSFLVSTLLNKHKVTLITNMEIFNINHSLKDIPIPPTDYYTKCLIDRTEEFIGRIRWAAFHFLNPNDKTSKKPPLETFGFRTNVAPPQIKELAPFEHELYELIANIKFRDKRSYTSHQRELTNVKLTKVTKYSYSGIRRVTSTR